MMPPPTRPLPPMHCRELVERVTDFLEDALVAEDRARLEEHLAECDECTDYLEQMRTTLRLTGRLSEEDVTPEIRAGLLGVFARWRSER